MSQYDVEVHLRAARDASAVLRQLTPSEKNEALMAMADSVWTDRESILAANALDVSDAERTGESKARLDRLRLTDARLRDMVQGLREIVELDDPVGEVLADFTRPNGLRIQQVRVPFGVIAVIYEARPNVTVDSAGLALKTGNAVLLRGGKESLRSNVALGQALQQGLARTNVPKRAVQVVENSDRSVVERLLRATDFVDLAIPRGGAGLIQHVKETALVPVIETGVGNCHVYIDGTADLEMAKQIVINAKTQRPSVCNAMETLLVQRALVESEPAWWVTLLSELAKKGVEMHVSEETLDGLKQLRIEGFGSLDLWSKLVLADEQDWYTEFLSLTLAVKLVAGVDEAIAHIGKYGTKHSEAIVAEDRGVAERFMRSVDAAAVYHNASTRFTDGFEFGFGAEIGISTQKLHARGPMGLKELTTTQYFIRGNGQVRS